MWTEVVLPVRDTGPFDPVTFNPDLFFADEGGWVEVEVPQATWTPRED